MKYLYVGQLSGEVVRLEFIEMRFKIMSVKPFIIEWLIRGSEHEQSMDWSIAFIDKMTNRKWY